MNKQQLEIKRIRRLFIWFSIARGLIFWYAIEKLFEISIGLSAQQIVLVGVIAQGSKLVLEVPTSAIADRWRRRNILMLAAVTMIIASCIVGLSNSMPVYIIGILFWSLSDALSSGVFEAFVYDSFASTGKKMLAKIYARLFSVFIITLGASALFAGLAAEHVSLRLGFFATIPPMVACIAILLKLPEPVMRRTVDDGMSWMRHIGSSMALAWRPVIRWPLVMYISLYGLTIIWYEFYQLIGIELRLTPFLFSCIMAVMTIGMALGGELSHRLKSSRFTITGVWAVLAITTVIGLRTGSTGLVFLNVLILFAVMRMMQIYLELYINSQLEANRRATVLSLASSLAYGWFFALALLYSQVLAHSGARWAFTVASLPILVMAVVDMLTGLQWAQRSTATTETGDR